MFGASAKMRADKTQSDLEYWMNSATHWTQKAETYFLASASKGLTKEDVAFFNALENRCRDMIFRSQLKFQEAQGLIEVYTGRAKPQMTVW